MPFPESDASVKCISVNVPPSSKNDSGKSPLKIVFEVSSNNVAESVLNVDTITESNGAITRTIRKITEDLLFNAYQPKRDFVRNPTN